MKARYRESKLTNILQTLGTFGWAGVAFCLSGNLWWLPVSLFFVLLGPGSAWLFGQHARRDAVLA